MGLSERGIWGCQNPIIIAWLLTKWGPLGIPANSRDTLLIFLFRSRFLRFELSAQK